MRWAFGAAALFLQMGLVAGAAEPTAAGYWHTVDEKSGRTTALVQITEEGGTFSGRIVEPYPPPGSPADPRCTRCDGTQKDRPVRGLVILTGLRRDGRAYRDGRILDPDSGSVYRASATLSADGESLEMRGYVGLPVFGRSQTWRRARPPTAHDSGRSAAPGWQGGESRAKGVHSGALGNHPFPSRH